MTKNDIVNKDVAEFIFVIFIIALVVGIIG